MAFFEGWHGAEQDGEGPFRWTGLEARCRMTNLPPAARPWLRLTAEYPDLGSPGPALSVTVNGAPGGRRVVEARRTTYLFPISPCQTAEVTLVLDRTFSVPGDGRALGLMVRGLEVIDLEPMSEPLAAEGWYPLETHEYFPFRWMGAQANVVIPPRALRRGRFLSVPIHSELGDGAQTLTISRGETLVARLPLWRYWNIYDVELTAASPSDKPALEPVVLRLAVDPLIPAGLLGSDRRQLGIRVGTFDFHDDLRRHRRAGAAADRKEQASGPPAPPRPAGPFHGDARNESDKFFPPDDPGWHCWDSFQGVEYRWMSREASLLVPESVRRQNRYGVFSLTSEFYDLSQVLTVLWNGRVAAEWVVLPKWHDYSLALPEAADGPVRLTFRLNKLIPKDRHPGDDRDLGLGVQLPFFHDDEAKHLDMVQAGEDDLQRWRDRVVPAGGTLELAADADGWFGGEYLDRVPFRWMSLEARLPVRKRQRRGHRYGELPLFSEFSDFSQTFSVSADGGVLGHWPLLHGWNAYAFPLPEPADRPIVLEFRVNKLVSPELNRLDPRPLGVRVGPPSFHGDESRFRLSRRLAENAVANYGELAGGATVLASFPPTLGIDLYGKCNIKPPCVYCHWDRTKKLEGVEVDAKVDDETLRQYGEFFACARTFVNCSFGEPLLHPRLEPIVELLDGSGKQLEMATNGQAFTPAAVRALAGKAIRLHISLDAASAATYARLRNDRWFEILGGLLSLRRVRRQANGRPKLYLVFMPMRANRDDLEPFFKLCRMVEADALVLRPLLRDAHSRVVERGGYRYDWRGEMLSREELEKVFDDSFRYAERYGITVVSEFDFGLAEPSKPRPEKLRAAEAAPEAPAEASPGLHPDGPAATSPPQEPLPVPSTEPPSAGKLDSGRERVPPSGPPPPGPAAPSPVARRFLCREPWETYYILRRGILPCCHGGKAIAKMSEWATAWNSAKLQEIRSHLARNRLSPYCFESPGCPIVQRHLAQKRRAATPEPAGASHAKSKVLRRINKALGGWPGRNLRWMRSFRRGKP